MDAGEPVQYHLDRRTFLAAAAGALAGTVAAGAEQAGKVARVGFLATTSTPTHYWDALVEALRGRGGVEGRNILFEQRYSEGKAERFPHLAVDLVRLKVDVIVTSGTPASVAAKSATTTIPIVMAVVIDPVGSGLVASLARPGGNVTGMSWLGPELSAKRLELLKEAVPDVSRVTVLVNPANPAHTVAVREMQSVASRLAMTLHMWEVRSQADFDRAFTAIARSRAEALFTVADPLTYRERARIVQFAAKARLPAIYEWREFVELGGLMAYGVNLTELYRRAAIHVDKILRGANPGDLPIEQPTKFELVINLKTAKALGLTIPPSLLQRADHVIE